MDYADNVSWMLTFATFLVSVATLETEDEVTREFCHMQPVDIGCRPGHVLLMTRARYGRMQLGDCVKRNLGYVGCAVDVMTYLDRRCSGRQRCEFPTPDPALHATSPCPEDTTPYLELTYRCLKVGDGKAVACHAGRPIVTSRSHGYLSTMTSEQYGVGAPQCPWRITVKLGQQVNLTLYNFNRGGTLTPSGDVKPWPADTCYEYATLRDAGTLVRLTMCSRHERRVHAHLSRSNNVTVTLVNVNVLRSLGAFLIEYRATGCPDIPPPPHGWVKRTGNMAAVGCNTTGHVWYVTCKDTAWIGQVGNCSVAGATSGSLFGDKGKFPYGILIVVAIGVALGVFFGGLLLSLASIYMRRRRRHECPYATEEQQLQLASGKGSDDMTLTCMHKLQYNSSDPDSGYPHNDAHCTPCRHADEHFPADVRRPFFPGRDVSRSGGGGCPTRGHIYECPQFK